MESGGQFWLQDYSRCSGVVVPSGAFFYVGNYNTVASATLMIGAYFSCGDNNQLDFNGDYVFLFSSSIVTAKGANLSGAVVAPYGSAHVFSGGTAVDIVMGSSSYMRVSSGAVAIGTQVSHYRAQLYVSAGGAASDTTVMSGSMYLYSRASGAGTICSGGYFAGSGGTATSLTMAHASADIQSNASVYALALGSGAYMNVWSSLLSGVEISAGGSLTLSAGGTASGITVASGGSLWVQSGASALKVASSTGAYVYSAAGAYVTYAA